MVTRVRYVRDNNGMFVSKSFVANGSVVLARFNPERNVDGVFVGQVVSGVNESNSSCTVVTGSTLNDVKKKLKTSLKQVGVNFNDEVRGRESETSTTT